MDAGAQSPKETWLRLLLIDAGFPRPQTQIPVFDNGILSRTSTWVGRTSRSPWSMTAINIARTAGDTPGTCGGYED